MIYLCFVDLKKKFGEILWDVPKKRKVIDELTAIRDHLQQKQKFCKTTKSAIGHWKICMGLGVGNPRGS